MYLPDIAGKHALVTGSTQGIGQAVCKALLARGSVVFGIAADESTRRSDRSYVPLRCDLSDPTALRAALATVKSQTECLDYLVNVAGIDPKYSVVQGDESKWEMVMNLNLRAYYLLIREALDLLKRGRGKSIVNISSINYRLGVPRRSIYSISKAGILGLTTGLARELGAEGIRVNTVSPGWVFTERQVREYFSRPGDREKNLAYLEQRQAIKRHITPEDVANHVLFYLSEVSAASTGHNCVVDAGWLLE